jgi:3-oxoacyl-[acyl-carrier-protein] synthase II
VVIFTLIVIFVFPTNSNKNKELSDYMDKRVVITGMGIVAPNGTGVEYAWKNVVGGVSGIRKIDNFDASDLPCQIAGLPIHGTNAGQYNPDAVVDVREQRKMDKSMLYGMVATDEAVRDAGLIEYDGDKTRIGVSIGSGIGGMQTIYDTCVDLHEHGPRYVSPFFIPKSIINMTAGQVSIKYGFQGPNLAVVTACATSAHSFWASSQQAAYCSWQQPLLTTSSLSSREPLLRSS